MKHEERWALWRQQRELAVSRYRSHWSEAENVGSWYCLLLAEELIWVPERSGKQVRQQKLFLARGLLERTKANIVSCMSLTTGAARDNLAAARSTLDFMIEHNKEQMRSL